MRRSLAVVIVALSGCKCGQNKVVYAGPHASAPAVLEFGKVRVGSRVVLPIAVLDDGGHELTVKAAVDASTDRSFRGLFSPAEQQKIPAGDTLDLPVEYIPAAIGEHRGKVALDTDSEGSQHIEVLLHGTGVTSTLQICRVDPAGESCDDNGSLTVDFGQVRPGSKVDRQLVLRARGDASIHIPRLALTPQSDSAYSLSGLRQLPYELPPGQEVRIGVSYAPVQGGPAPGQIEVLSDSEGRPRKLVDLTGQGIAPRLCIDVKDLDFSGVDVGRTAGKTAQLRSCGLEPLRIDSISTQAPFSATPQLPQTLQPGSALALPLAFAPKDTGPVQRPLAIATNELKPGQFTLSGEGLQCILALVPATIDFGQVSTSVKASKMFHMRATGYSDCKVSALRGPTGTAGFSLPLAPATPLVLPLGQDVDIQVDFQPRAAGSAAAQLAIDSDDSTAPTQTVRLIAQGTAPPPCDFFAQPASVQFGAVDVGQSATSNVVVTNRGTDECYITGGGASGDPSFTATIPGGSFPPPTLGSGASVTVPVKYKPASSTLHLGQLTVKYNKDPVSLGGDQTLTVPLQGGTLTPKMCLAPTLLDFGAVSPGGKSIKAFTVSSCGDGTLTVRGIEKAAGTSADFSMAPPAMPLVLAKGASATINVQYQPAAAGAAAGVIDVFSNDPLLLTGKVELRGNLGPCATQLVCSPAQVSFPGTEVGRTSAQPVTCIAAGQAVTVSSVAATGSGDLTLQAGKLPVTLQPGDTLRAEVQFAPSSAAAAVATFTLQTGGCGNARIDVEAIGLPPNFPHCPVATTFTPRTKWAWNGGQIKSDWSNVTMTPAVANLTDDNADGRVDENDVPEVIFSSCSTASCCVNCFDPQHLENADLSGEAVLRAVSGKDGRDVWTASDLRVPAGSQIAVADLNGDGEPEIIAVQHSFRPGQTCPNSPADSLPMCFKYITGSLLVLDRTGRLLFVSEPWSQPPEVIENDGAILVADLDQDGYPEMVFGDTVFDSTGHVKWRMSRTLGNTGHGLTAAAADLDGDGKLELIAGPTAYRADGSVLWQAAHVDDGIALVMDVDGDGKPEVVVRPTASHIVILDGATGSIKRDIQLQDVNASACPAGPSAGDFLGNGRMQLAVPAGNWFFLLRPDTGEILWKKPIQDYDGQCGSSGAAVFSFFGDGKNDIVYHDSENIWVWRADGTQVYNAPRKSSTLWETPVIADIDNDGHAEILITNQGLGGTNNGLTALSDEANSWPATRRVWTQWNYHVTDANENATVPRVEQPFWKTSKLWRGNPPLCNR